MKNAAHVRFLPIHPGRLIIIILSIACTLGLISLSCGQPSKANDNTVPLKDNWHIQSSRQCKETGKTISTPAFSTEGWYETPVPCTVLAALVKNNRYRDIYLGKNLEQISSEPFRHSWWYRKEFILENIPLGSTARLVFEGINYRAGIWLNGREVAAADSIAGAFRIFDLDISTFIRTGKNVLAVEVFPPKAGDFTIGFADWNPPPPDGNMGLWRGVKLRLTGPVSLNHPFVQSKVKPNTPDRAFLTVTAQLVNHSPYPVSGEVTGKIENINLSQPFSLKSLEKKKIIFTPAQYKELNIMNPRLWWPNNLGEPHLYRLEMEVLADREISDSSEVTFGIREVSDYIDENGHRGYMINGKKILIRGGGWTDDLLLAEEDDNLEAQIKYAKHMNLNTIRLEGFWGSSRQLYHLADRYGILVMPGWSCQWEWQGILGKSVDGFGGIQTPEEMELAARSLTDQVLWLRNHPGIFVWVLASDKLPRPALEKMYRSYLKEIDPTRPVLAACKYHVSKVSGSTGVKMNGPYDYVPPVYWYVDRKNGGAFGFNTETGPGPQPPPLESIKRMIPADRLWPVDEVWNFHCARKKFNTLDRYMEALNRRYGKPSSPEEFARKAQVANYEAIRGMFEAFGANKPNTTGIIQWMLNSAWPEMYWQLYDYYLMPNGAFYGTKTACRPLHILYHYGNNTIYVVNDTLSPYKNLKATVHVLDIDAKTLFFKTLPVDIAANSAKKILDIPALDNLTPVYFLDLELRKSSGARGNQETIIGDNFYWLPVKKDVLDERGTTWYYTPMKGFADFTALEKLAPVKIEAIHRFETLGSGRVLHVTLKNPTDKIAFFVELQLVGETSGQSILPVYWEDNYISLLPREVKTLRAWFSLDDTRGERPVFRFSGWNIE